MGDTERPTPERLGDQEEQAQRLTRTGNGPTVDNESELLAEQYGAPDMAGHYTASDAVDQDGEQPEGEPADQGDTAAADTPEGGASA
jgi:hypothetical protein